MIKKISIITTILFNLFSSDVENIIKNNLNTFENKSEEFEKAYFENEKKLNDVRSKIILPDVYAYPIDINDIYYNRESEFNTNEVTKFHNLLTFIHLDNNEVQNQNEAEEIFFNLINKKIPIVKINQSKIYYTKDQIITIIEELDVHKLIKNFLLNNPRLEKTFDNFFFTKYWEEMGKKDWQEIWEKDKKNLNFEMQIVNEIYKDKNLANTYKIILRTFYSSSILAIIKETNIIDYKILNDNFNIIDINYIDKNSYNASLQKYFFKYFYTYFQTTPCEKISFKEYHNRVIMAFNKIIEYKKSSLQETKNTFLEEHKNLMTNIWIYPTDKYYKDIITKNLFIYKKKVEDLEKTNDLNNYLIIAAYTFFCFENNQRVYSAIKENNKNITNASKSKKYSQDI